MATKTACPFEAALDELAAAHADIRERGRTDAREARRCWAIDDVWDEFTKVPGKPKLIT